MTDRSPLEIELAKDEILSENILKRVDVDLYISQLMDQQTEAIASLAKSFESIAKSIHDLTIAIEKISSAYHYGRHDTVALYIRGPDPHES